MIPVRIGILGSTRGTAMAAIVAAIETGELPGEIALVVSNKADAIILQRAREQHLTTQFVDPIGKTRDEYDQEISALFQQHAVDLIMLIGYMRLLSATFVTRWQHKLINVHPSLLPAFAGKMDLDVHRAALAAGVKETGCTVHFVTEDVDAGPILLQAKCEVREDDTPESLKARVQALEGLALVASVKLLSNPT